MALVVLYGLKNCDTCKKALKALDAYDVTFVDIRADAELDHLLPKWLDAVGAEMLVNKRSTTWRGLSDAEKATVEDGGAVALLFANPTLIKRPVIEANGEIYVGWTKDVAAALGV